jgi:hypothetical protein
MPGPLPATSWRHCFPGSSRDCLGRSLFQLAAWLFGAVVAVMTVGTLALLYVADVGAEILLAVVAAVATL